MKIEKWILNTHDQHKRERLLGLRQRYDFLMQQLFHEYLPTMNSNDESINKFTQRLNLWLDQFKDEAEQIAAFESIEYFFFAGTKEFNELYRCAAVNIERWIISRQKLNPFLSETLTEVKSILKKSWICPVTDSFKINDFLHITNLSALDIRADWYSLSKLGYSEKIRDKSNNVKYLILLEDFTGTGKQILKVLQFALETTELEILLLPMIACAPGANKVSSFIENDGKGRVQFEPIVLLAENCLVGPNQKNGEPMLFKRLRKVMESHAANFKRINAYGFGKVGCLAATYSNCPNNTPPLYHKALKNHQALFPRLPRNG